MTIDARLKLAVLKVDGGATVNNTLMQLQADILGVPVVWEPTWSTDRREESYRGWQKAVERTLNWVDVEPGST